ncbi:hypothetical protein ACFSF3_25975 [Vibrio chagasii]
MNAGETLPAVSLTADDSDNATAVDSDTPTYKRSNDGPTIDVVAEAAFNENDARRYRGGDVHASDEEDGTPSVAFTPGHKHRWLLRDQRHRCGTDASGC